MGRFRGGSSLLSLRDHVNQGGWRRGAGRQRHALADGVSRAHTLTLRPQVEKRRELGRPGSAPQRGGCELQLSDEDGIVGKLLFAATDHPRHVSLAA